MVYAAERKDFLQNITTYVILQPIAWPGYAGLSRQERL